MVIVLVTLTLLVSSHLLRKRIVISFVNKDHRLLLSILCIYMMGMSVLAVVIFNMMRINDYPENSGVSILFYLISAMFMVMAPAFIVSKDDVESLKYE